MTVLVKAYTSLNLGDDLFLKILFERYPRINFILIAPKVYAQHMSNFGNVKVLPPPKFSFFNRGVNHVLQKFSSKLIERRTFKLWELFIKDQLLIAEVFLLIGGSMFIQSVNNEMSIYNKIDKLFSLQFREKQKIIIGANFGPFSTQSFYNYYKEIFKEFDDVCFRESFSKELFSSLSNVRCCPDIVFQLKVPAIEKLKNSVGFSVINLSTKPELVEFEEQYLYTMVKFIMSYTKQGYIPFLFAFCKAEGDGIFISKIISNLPADIGSKVQTVYYDGNIEDFINIYGKIEVMYVTRFHAMILSSLFNQFIYPIAYSTKMINVLEDLRYSGSYTTIIDIKNINVDEVMYEVKTNTLRVDECQKKESERQFEILDRILLN